jgi:hypothetical protein
VAQFSASDYLETALLPVAGSGPAVAAKNAIRASIKALFPDRGCATLVRPMHDEQVCACVCACVRVCVWVCGWSVACYVRSSRAAWPGGANSMLRMPCAMPPPRAAVTPRCRLRVCVCQALVAMDAMTPEQLRPEFRQGVAALLQLILAKVCACVCVCVCARVRACA